MNYLGMNFASCKTKKEINAVGQRSRRQSTNNNTRVCSEATNNTSENAEQEFKYLLDNKEKEISVRCRYNFQNSILYHLQFACSEF